ncbi:MAG TPA: alpha/beta hydrolase [Bacteroidales bacterium]|nr:alpha/beta hydrolase [Bacteroidales bacterium]HPF02059.1 alpha/beta hydrolase [Bacteroidales bacterium]HPJ60035.1 alpha/beta hydrolase [Bacteroidales bacterium]HPR11454.1 alpha/beta hydrolase [Bacteroidales bacterium]HRW86121.1 alpha/beta hydrolase [Bacteroidales bacterium]
MKEVLIFLLLLTFFTAESTFCQDTEPATLSLTLKDSFRGNRKIPLKIFYPGILSEQQNNSRSMASEIFPAIIFAHGYLMKADEYEPVCRMLVREGYIVVFPCSERGWFPSHRDLADDIAYVAADISRIGSDPSSPLYGHVGENICLMGHSMGGGASFLAAAKGVKAAAIVTFAAFDTRPSAVSAAAEVTLPGLIFAGSRDCITPPEKHQIPMFNALASSSKTYILLKGGSHCNMGSESKKCNRAEKISGCHTGSMETGEITSLIGRYLLPWLRFYLKNDLSSGKCFNEELKTGEGIEYLQSGQL